MSISSQPSNIQYLQALKQRAGVDVQNAVQVASRETGVDFAYLMEQAAVESNFDHDAKAKTSSASGLYQFIESTWLNMVKEHGDKYGLDEEAKSINSNGRVSDPSKRADILELRNDPKIASLMAGELAADNKAYLEKNYSGEIGSTELYMAHFLGAGNASAFLNAAQETPNAVAADIFPKAALANRNVFFDQATGQPRTLAQMYDFFDQKFKYDDIAPEPNASDEMRVAKRPLRGFTGDGTFQADVAQARALGAMLMNMSSDLPGLNKPKTVAQSMHGLIDTNTDMSLFEQLQYKRSSYSRVSLPTASVENFQAEANQPLSNEDFLSLFSNKS